jgi:hypothetical protein
MRIIVVKQFYEGWAVWPAKSTDPGIIDGCPEDMKYFDYELCAYRYAAGLFQSEVCYDGVWFLEPGSS